MRAAITLAATSLALAACNSPAPVTSGLPPAAASDAAVVTRPAAPAAAAQTLSETGSSLMAPLFARWGPAYHARFSQVTIRTTSSSSGTGIANPGMKLPGTGIVRVHRGDDSGSTFLFTSYLNAQDPSGWSGSLIGTTIAWPGQPGELSAAGTDAMISSVRSAPGAIGYVGVSYLAPVRAAGEGEAALGNSAGGYVLPAAATIRAALGSFINTPASETISLINGAGAGAQAYPIVNDEYAIVSTAQTSAVRAQDLRAFLSWAITSGAAQLARVNFQPLPSSVVTLSGAQIAKIKADT